MVLDQENKTECKVCSPGWYMSTVGRCAESGFVPVPNPVPNPSGEIIGAFKLFLAVLALLY